MLDVNTFYQVHFQVKHEKYLTKFSVDCHTVIRAGLYLILVPLNNLMGDSIVILIGWIIFQAHS